MAHPIRFQTTRPDPDAHAEAMLEAYELLQTLHDRGILDACRSALAAADEILDTGVSAAESPGTIRALRNLLFLYDVLGGIDPERLQAMAQAIPDGLAAAQRDDQPSLWTVIRRATSRDTLRGLMACFAILEGFGRHLRSPAQSTQPRDI
jgi:uncharacterized protein YjgD (DUF1641 family)